MTYTDSVKTENVVVESFVAKAQGQFGNPEEEGHLLLEEVTGGLVKTQQAEKTCCFP
jgi:hypothetical protein